MPEIRKNKSTKEKLFFNTNPEEANNRNKGHNAHSVLT